MFNLQNLVGGGKIGHAIRHTGCSTQMDRLHLRKGEKEVTCTLHYPIINRQCSEEGHRKEKKWRN
jgi:hypothetical protein